MTGCSMFPASVSAVSRAIAGESASPKPGLRLEKCLATSGGEIGDLPLLSWVCAIAAPLIDITAPQRKTALASAVMLVTCRDLKSGGPHLLLMRMLGRSRDATAAAAGPST